MTRARDNSAILSTAPANNSGAMLNTDTTQINGFAWTGPFETAGKNLIQNGAMDWWTRGTSQVVTAAGANLTADRWNTYLDTSVATSVTVSQISVAGVSGVPAGVQYAMRIAKTAGQTTDRTLLIGCYDALPQSYVGQYVTASAYVRVNNGSTSGINVNLSTRSVKTGPNYDTANTSYAASSFNSTSFTRVSTTMLVTQATITNNAQIFELEITGYPAVGGYYDITAVQLEIGTVPTVFTRAGGSPTGDLMLCQKYYETSYDINTAPVPIATLGSYSAAKAATLGTTGTAYTGSLQVQYKVPKRTTPSITTYGYSSTPTTGTTSMTYNVNNTGDFNDGSVLTNGLSGFTFQFGQSYNQVKYFGWIANSEI